MWVLGNEGKRSVLENKQKEGPYRGTDPSCRTDKIRGKNIYRTLPWESPGVRWVHALSRFPLGGGLREILGLGIKYDREVVSYLKGSLETILISKSYQYK